MPDLIRHPVFSWIPAFAGMTLYAINYVAVYGIPSVRDHAFLRGGSIDRFSPHVKIISGPKVRYALRRTLYFTVNISLTHRDVHRMLFQPILTLTLPSKGREVILSPPP